MNTKRGGRTTKDQYHILVDFVEKNTEILYPRKAQHLGEKNLAKKWEALKNCLNNSGAGPTKNIKQWKKVVSELKLHTRKKLMMNRQEISSTDGSFRKWHFLNYEERFLRLLKPSLEGPALPGMETKYLADPDLQKPEYIEPAVFFVKTEEEEVVDPIAGSIQTSSENSREPVDSRLDNSTDTEEHEMRVSFMSLQQDKPTAKSKATNNRHASRLKRSQGLHSRRACSYLLKKYEELVKNQLEVQERIAESNNNLANALNNVSSSLDKLSCILKK